MLTALNASQLALRRDPCGDYDINGKSGHIYQDGVGFLLCVPYRQVCAALVERQSAAVILPTDSGRRR